MKPYKVGTRVELHPATDAWMMGDRFGEVTGIKLDRTRVVYYLVTMDRSGTTRKIGHGNIGRVV